MKAQSKVHPGLLSRRDFIKLGGALGGASMLAACGGIRDQGSQRVPTPLPPPRGSPSTSAPALSSPLAPRAGTAAPAAAGHGEGVAMRIAHISDMHIEPGSPGVKGFRRALRHVHALDPAVDFILNTGDCVMDSLEADKDRAALQWEAFNSVLREEVSLPIYHAIGNHDVWGWGLPSGVKSEAGKDPDFGKGLALAELGIPDRYYSFEHNGWRFLVLDSTHLPDLASGKPYTGKLDEEQYAWLVLQLEAVPSSNPVCVVSHIPVLAACEYLDGDNETSGNWIVPGAWVHIDARRLWRLFWQHPNVRLCLSGHTHQVEDLRYHGVQYLTNGAICANWWNGSYFDFPPGYVVLTLYQDGTAASEFVTY
jgi:Icc protein